MSWLANDYGTIVINFIYRDLLMDITALNTKKTASLMHTVNFMNPLNGTPLEHDSKAMYAIVVSKNSKEYEQSLSRIVNASKKAEKFGEQAFSYSAEKMKKANLLASCTKRLVFFENDSWVDIEASSLDDDAQHKAIRDAYLEYDWMLDQVDLEVGNNANFLGKSETNFRSM